VGIGLPESALGIVLWLFLKLWIALFPAAWRRLVDRRPLSLSPPRQGGLGVAALTGGGIAAVIVLAWWALGRSLIEPGDLRGILEPYGLTDPAVFVAGAAGWILVNSALEEYVFRWFVLEKCEALLPAPAAVVASSALFTVHHVVVLGRFFDPLPAALACLGVFLGGVLWAVLYRRYRSVWIPWISHAAADVGVFAVGAVLLFG
jgi:membrane protease YdiL (CAAX protease family)